MKDYKVVKSHSIEILESSVKHNRNNGWSLQGGVSSFKEQRQRQYI
ncbi:hypothetical protein [Dokdonia sp. Asnod1-B02]